MRLPKRWGIVTLKIDRFEKIAELRTVTRLDALRLIPEYCAKPETEYLTVLVQDCVPIASWGRINPGEPMFEV